jgi:hypothetical protein
MATERSTDESDSENKTTETTESTSLVDDPQTDHVVDEIMHDDSDEVIAAEDAKIVVSPNLPWYKKIFARKKIWTPLVIVLLLVAILAVPWTRYKILGLVIKKSYNVTVIDAQTKLPVSDATVGLAGKRAITDDQGDVTLKAPVGTNHLSVSKQYYKSTTTTVLVPLRKQAGGTYRVSLLATGRQVPLTVLNKITGAPLSDVEITAAGTSAKTNAAGQVTMVLPAYSATESATFSDSGYASVSGTITVTAGVVASNTFKLLPNGRVYFLSNASGKIDVVSTNLDGSSPQTVLAGTGNEQPNDTILLSSSDWQYLALAATRTAGQQSDSLYLVNTQTGKLTTIDGGNDNFTPLGWSGHYFVYDALSNAVQYDQAGGDMIKSYDADTGQTTTLDQTQTQTSGSSTFYQGFNNEYLLNDGKVAYNVVWYADYPADNSDFNGQNDSIRAAQVNGNGKQDYKTFSASQTGSIQAVQYAPSGVYYGVSNLGGTSTVNYAFDDNSVTTPQSANFSAVYPTFLPSPSGDQTFWSQTSNGNNNLFVGDENGSNGSQVASASTYAPYGWYTGNYLLVEKGSNQLYIMSAKGSTPFKISDYYKPPQPSSTSAYGGSYGEQ